jgi:hypothetical protein
MRSQPIGRTIPGCSDTTARVQAVLHDVDGGCQLGVTAEDDPAADLLDSEGRYLDFDPDELVPRVSDLGPSPPVERAVEETVRLVTTFLTPPLSEEHTIVLGAVAVGAALFVVTLLPDIARDVGIHEM